MRALSLLLLSLLLFVQSAVSSSSSSSQFNLRRHREVSKDGISPKVSSGKRRPNHHRRAYELINGRKYFQHKPRRTQRRGQRRRTAKEDNSKEEVVLDLRRRGKPKKADEQPKNRLFKYNRKPSSNASKKKAFKDHSRGRRHNVPVPQFLMLP